MTARRLRLHGDFAGSQYLPVSQCMEPCRPGTLRRIPSDPRRFCCWSCIRCLKRHFSASVNSLSCTECPTDQIANENNTACQVPELLLQPWSAAWTWIIIVLVMANFLLGTFCLAYFLHYRSEKIFRASNFHHMMVVIVAALIGDVLTLVTLYMDRDTGLKCIIRREILFLPSMFAFVAILMKTNRMRHIFSSVRLVRDGRLHGWSVSVRGQMTHMTIISLVIFIIAMLPVFWYPPKPLLLFVSERSAGYICKESLPTDISSLAIFSLCIVLTLCLAFSTRNLPQEYNDSRLIVYTSAMTIIVFVGLSPTLYNAGLSFRPLVILLVLLCYHSANLIGLCASRVIWHRFDKPKTAIRKSQGSSSHEPSMPCLPAHEGGDGDCSHSNRNHHGVVMRSASCCSCTCHTRQARSVMAPSSTVPEAVTTASKEELHHHDSQTQFLGTIRQEEQHADSMTSSESQ